MALLSTNERKSLVEAIDKAEKTTSGDIVAVVLKESDEYLYIPLLWSAGLALFAPAVIGLLGLDWSLLAIYGAQIGVFVVSNLLFQLSPLKGLLLPSSVKHRRANRNARTLFFDHGLHATPDNNAIMIFVSELEHHVEIIADHGINAQVPDGYWQELVNELTSQIRAGKSLNGLVHAVEQCGDLLTRHFPSDDLRDGSLSNDVIDK